ncbi:MAG: ATP-binding protein [Verrucomicrobiota bacterium]
MGWWRTLLDYFTPESLRKDLEAMRRLRLMVGLSFLGLVLGGMYGVFYWAIGHYWGMAIIVACIVSILIVPFLIRATGRIRLGGNLSVLVWVLGFSALTAIEGGIRGSAIAWLACGLPLIALLILDRIEALFWCVVCLLITLFFCGLDLARIILRPIYSEKWDSAILSGSIVGLVIFMSLLGILFEYARKQAFLEQQRMQQAKRLAEGENRAKDQFLAVLSHELRTPLTPVLAMVSEWEDQDDLPVDMRAEISVVRRNVELEAKLIDDLLDATRISSGKLVLDFKAVDAHSCLRSALEICLRDIHAKKLQVSVDFGAKEHYVQADPVRLRQVFWNLLRNAVKFTPCQGRISLLTTNVGDRLRIQIADTGVGIEPEVIPRIFNAFEQGEKAKTRHFGGLGLGLSIAKAIVEIHHGQITAVSGGKDKGAVLTVELTAIAAPAEQPVILVHSEPGNGELPRILLVEDDSDTRRTLTKLLQRHGYRVISADCIRDGLELSGKGSFDVVISDLGLPDGSGLDFMRQMKALYGLPGIALSGYGTDEDFRQSRAAGFERHIIKPVNFSVLCDAIQLVVPKAA